MKTLIEKLPIKEKLMLIIMLISVLGLLLSVTAFLYYDNYRAKKDLVNDISATARLIADRSSAALLFDDEKLAQENLHALRVKPSVSAACIYNASGAVFAGYSSADGTGVPCPAAAGNSGHEFQKNSLALFEPILFDGKQVGSVYIFAGLKELYVRRNNLLLMAALIVIVTFVLAFFISSKLQRLISGPLISLTETARVISQRKDYSVRAVKSSQDETGVLVDAFNEMLATINAHHKDNVKLNAELEARVLSRTAQLEAANKELEAFSYSVSHDLRAPLRHASGFVDLLVSRYKEGLPEKALHYLDSIADSVRQMGELIDDLLQFSRTGRAEMRLAPADMNAMVREVLEPLRHDNSARDVEWVIGGFPQVFCDGPMLKLVWTNLLGNALKFTRTRLQARIEAGFREEAEEFVFFVRDNGVGFDMRYAKNLFGVFQRLHTTEEFEGTGIGLANVRRIVLRHGGRIWAEAELEKGAAFYFTLPKNRQEAL
jgi:signal transduction histidine kinase